MTDTFEEMFRKRHGRGPTVGELRVLIDQSVTSHNQSGGITAHTVNIAPQPRVLDEPAKAQLLQIVPKSLTVMVDCPMGNSEAYRFGQQIWDFLQANGYTMGGGGLGQSVRVPPPPANSVGIDITSKPGIVDIVIGPLA